MTPRFIGLCLFLLLFSSGTAARTVYFRDPLSINFESPLKNGLLLGKPGLSFNSNLLGLEPKKSSYSAHLSFPVFYSRAKIREAGWAFALSGGRSPAVLSRNLLQPGLYFWELSFGRGTYGQFGGQEEGFLGFFSFSLRNERIDSGPEHRQLVERLGKELKDYNYIVSMRLGAAQHPFGTGLVRQKRPLILSRFVGDLSFQIHNKIPRVKVKSDFYTNVLWKGFFMGISGQWNHFISKETGFKAFEVRHSYHFGPSLQYLTEHISFETWILWNYFYNNRADYFQSTPTLQLSLSIGV